MIILLEKLGDHNSCHHGIGSRKMNYFSNPVGVSPILWYTHENRLFYKNDADPP